MAVINVTLEDTFDEWRQKTNSISTGLGDVATLSGYSASDVIAALNELKTSASFYNEVTITDLANDNLTKLSTDATELALRVNAIDALVADSLGNVDVANDLGVANDTSIGGDLAVTGNTNLSGTLGVTGTATLANDVNVGGNHAVTGNINVSGNESISGDSTISGNLAVSGTTNVVGLAVSGGLGVSGATTLDGTLTTNAGFVANGSVAFNGNTTIGNAASDTLTLTASLNTGIMPSSDNSKNIGGSSLRWANMYAVTFRGNATTANYADLAEKYLADGTYEAGTVMSVGGEKEITPTTAESAHSILGVVSDYPAYLMNGNQEGGTPVALKGRVPVRVKGDVKKGDRLTISDEAGVAEANNANGVWTFAIALADGTDLVEAVIL